jgi:hypothetical protein
MSNTNANTPTVKTRAGGLGRGAGSSTAGTTAMSTFIRCFPLILLYSVFVSGFPARSTSQFGECGKHGAPLACLAFLNARQWLGRAAWRG